MPTFFDFNKGENMRKIIIMSVLIFSLAIISCSPQEKITSYEECVAAGYPIMESYPERCSDGFNTFTRELTEKEKSNLENPNMPEEPVGLANPASVNCEEIGGELEIRNSPLGQYGVCIKDGSECEEWALFKGECDFEESRTYCTQAQKEANICTMEFMPVCGYKEVQCIKAPCPPISETYSNKCGACSAGSDYWVQGDCLNQ